MLYLIFILLMDKELKIDVKVTTIEVTISYYKNNHKIWEKNQKTYFDKIFVGENCLEYYKKQISTQLWNVNYFLLMNS